MPGTLPGAVPLSGLRGSCLLAEEDHVEAARLELAPLAVARVDGLHHGGRVLLLPLGLVPLLQHPWEHGAGALHEEAPLHDGLHVHVVLGVLEPHAEEQLIQGLCADHAADAFAEREVVVAPLERLGVRVQQVLQEVDPAALGADGRALGRELVEDEAHARLHEVVVHQPAEAVGRAREDVELASGA